MSEETLIVVGCNRGEAMVGIRLCPRCCCHRWVRLYCAYDLFALFYVRPLCANVTSSTKLTVTVTKVFILRFLLKDRKRITESFTAREEPSDVHRQHAPHVWWYRRPVFRYDRRQTDRKTDTLIAVLRTTLQW